MRHWMKGRRLCQTSCNFVHHHFVLRDLGVSLLSSHVWNQIAPRPMLSHMPTWEASVGPVPSIEVICICSSNIYPGRDSLIVYIVHVHYFWRWFFPAWGLNLLSPLVSLCQWNWGLSMSHVIQQFAGVFPLPLEISNRTQGQGWTGLLPFGYCQMCDLFSIAFKLFCIEQCNSESFGWPISLVLWFTGYLLFWNCCLNIDTYKDTQYVEVGVCRLEKQGTRHIECCAHRFSGWTTSLDSCIMVSVNLFPEMFLECWYLQGYVSFYLYLQLMILGYVDRLGKTGY